MTPETKKALLETLKLDDLAYLVQMVIDGCTREDREKKLLEFAGKSQCGKIVGHWGQNPIPCTLQIGHLGNCDYDISDAWASRALEGPKQ